MDGVSCAPLLPVNLVSRGKRDAMINALFQNSAPYRVLIRTGNRYKPYEHRATAENE
jgi:hypothetical protein